MAGKRKSKARASKPRAPRKAKAAKEPSELSVDKSRRHQLPARRRGG